MLCNKASPNSTTPTALLLMRLYIHWTVCPWLRPLDWGLVVQDVLSHVEARWLWRSVGAEGQQDDGGDWAMCLSLPRRQPKGRSTCSYPYVNSYPAYLKNSRGRANTGLHTTTFPVSACVTFSTVALTQAGQVAQPAEIQVGR